MYAYLAWFFSCPFKSILTTDILGIYLIIQDLQVLLNIPECCYRMSFQCHVMSWNRYIAPVYIYFLYLSLYCFVLLTTPRYHTTSFSNCCLYTQTPICLFFLLFFKCLELTFFKLRCNFPTALPRFNVSRIVIWLTYLRKWLPQ